jgi:4-amino-4-deoxy-L-arabinose transferase-like glycosyltransferase
MPPGHGSHRDHFAGLQDQTTRWVTPAARGRGWRELVLVVLGFGVLTVVLIAPLAFHLGSVGRLDNADTRLLIWNVAWVARTLIVDPLHVFDANIFYPHRGTLAYSESNLGAGVLAIPIYWATRNPYAAHNAVVLLSFVLSATSTYYLVRYLAGDRRAAAVAGICFAYCPYAFSHLTHVHLLMTAGLPLSMLAFHRLADRPTTGRGAALGLAVAAQALFCGYYAVFVGLTVGFAVLVVGAARRRWRDARYWTAVAVAAVVAIAIALPLFVPYIRLQHESGFSRSLVEARLFSAHWRTYFASSAYAHAWMLPIVRHWNEILFPGFVAVVAGVAGLGIGWRARGRLREVSILYGGLGALAFWASLGPDAGLYRVLSSSVPAFSLMRAPSRFGLVVAFALSVLAGVSISALLARLGRPARPGTLAEGHPAPGRSRIPALAAIMVAAVAVLELKVPLSFSPAPPVETAYRVLATLPRGPVIEIPFYSRQFASLRTHYMLGSTTHWMPLVNGYSSYTPPEFVEKAPALAGFPSLEAFRILERDRVRYAVFHMNTLRPDMRDDLARRIWEFGRYLARRYADDRIWLYEIVEFPR